MKVFDLHCDTLSELRLAEKEGREARFDRNGLHIDLEKLQKGDYLLQCFACYVNLGTQQTLGEDPLCTALEEADVFHRIMEKYADKIAPVYTGADIEKNAAAGKISGMLTIEDAGCCLGSLGALRMLYRLGARMATLTWNYENTLAYPNGVPGEGSVWPCRPNTTDGLKPRGFEFLAEMERLHMLADVSHLSDAGFWDICRASTRPFVASHSNARALGPHCRNLTDEMIDAMAARGCLVGLNYCGAFLDDEPDEEKQRSTVARMAQHARYLTNRGGMALLGLGSDFDGIGGHLEMKSCADLPLLAEALRKEGFTEDEVEAIFYRNAKRFFEENL